MSCTSDIHEQMKNDDTAWRSLRFGYIEALLGDGGRYEWYETRHCYCGSSLMRETVSRTTWRLWDPRRPYQILAGYPSTIGHNGAMTLTLVEYNAIRSKRYRYKAGRIVEATP